MTSTQPVGSSGAGVPDPVSLPPRTPGRWAAMILGAPGVGVVAAVVAWLVASSAAPSVDPLGAEQVGQFMTLLVTALVVGGLVQAAGVVLLVRALFPAGLRLETGSQAALLGVVATVLGVMLFPSGLWLVGIGLVLVAPWLTSMMLVSADARVRSPADAASHG